MVKRKFSLIEHNISWSILSRKAHGLLLGDWLLVKYSLSHGNCKQGRNTLRNESSGWELETFQMEKCCLTRRKYIYLIKRCGEYFNPYLSLWLTSKVLSVSTKFLWSTLLFTSVRTTKLMNNIILCTKSWIKHYLCTRH